MPKPRIDFRVWFSRTTEHDVVSDHGPAFATVELAEKFIQTADPAWEHATIYEVETTWDSDDMGPIPVERDLSSRQYVRGDGGRFDLDEHLVE